MSSRLHEFEKLYQRVIEDIGAKEERIKFLLPLFNDLVITLSETTSLHFNTPFARVSYITSRYQLGRPWSYAFQIVRRELKKRELPDDDLYPILASAIEYLLTICRHEWEHPGRSDVVVAPPVPKLPPIQKSGRFKKQFARTVVTAWDPDTRMLSAIDEEEPGVMCQISYAEDKNEIFAETLELAIKEIGLPFVLGLADIDTTEDDHYVPGFIILLPDLLLDVTSISTTWSQGPDPEAINMIDQFLPSESTEHILTGQVANYFLDELIRDSTLTYEALFKRTFKIYPVEFVLLDDDKLRSMYDRMRSHYDHIRQVIEEKFPMEGIQKEECIIEPSYFSPQYGIKGRLDLYYQHEDSQTASIIELKSGKPFRPNAYGLSHDHYHQTLLYELLIKSAHGAVHHRKNFILYSSMAVDPLRFAVSVESIQKEAIQNRNLQVLLLMRMLKLDLPGARDIVAEINPNRFPELKGYILKDIQRWHSTYEILSEGEKAYFRSYAAFITREHMLARIGNENGEGSGGLAGLWLDKTETKESRYQILRGLELVRVVKSDNQTLLAFLKTDDTNPLANFRAGDIGILYPYHPQGLEDPTRHQLHRANVIEVNGKEVLVRLRNNQVHTRQMEKIRKWNLEHDLLDSSFRSLYQSLWSFISSGAEYRQLFYGLFKPGRSILQTVVPIPDGLTGKQLNVFKEGIEAEKLYLLWGPPGTGKTSRMLKSWVWYYFHHTGVRIALLAYTNRAVDEICQALHSMGENFKENYIRIGSKAGSGEMYRERLLDNVIDPFEKRADIRKLMEDTRIYVGTVASLHGKSEIFRMIQFDVAIIDEASQILEPAIVGLLTHFKKSILVGDHMQLPAVSTQPVNLTKLNPQPGWAKRIGLSDLSMSFFERLFRLYRSKGWEEMIGLLDEQGRMHEDIQAFANRHIYHHQLTCLDPLKQTVALEEITGITGDPLFTRRMVYIPSGVRMREHYQKTNEQEAHLVISLISEWKEVITRKNLQWSIGVITPFRAQISAILHIAQQAGINLEGVTVDTVERYQGGARDIVIMSCAVNNRQSLKRIISLNEEGIDRKLNVAVTRAKQQFILIGEGSILQEEPSYRSLIEMCVEIPMSSRVFAEGNP
jgi:DNA replication ATP-dependent helicase Dna2